MKLPAILHRWAVRQVLRSGAMNADLFDVPNGRAPDLVIGDPAAPYLKRWYVIPRNPVANIYLHLILRSDEDRALHDHPWWNISVVLIGGYFEHRIAAGGISSKIWRGARSLAFRGAATAHRLEIDPAHASCAVTLSITGPRFREWGFHCAQAGWRHWRDFTAGPNGETVGRGCGEMDAALRPAGPHHRRHGDGQ